MFAAYLNDFGTAGTSLTLPSLTEKLTLFDEPVRPFAYDQIQICVSPFEVTM